MAGEPLDASVMPVCLSELALVSIVAPSAAAAGGLGWEAYRRTNGGGSGRSTRRERDDD